MKNARVWFKKDLECRYISHLDLNRCMLRALHKSKVPIWHTEGFNPHPFATFPLPLSLGFRGVCECMDIKVEDDNFPKSDIIDGLNSCLPRGIRVYDVTEPVMKAGQIAYASFTAKLTADEKSPADICAELESLFSLDKIEIEKHTKKGLKTVDIKPGIKSFSFAGQPDCTVVEMVLSAGSSENVNPNLIIGALEKLCGCEIFADITRNNLFNSEIEIFK